MNILILTQKADKNDPILGFFHRWIIEFSKNFEAVTVICLEKGVCELPVNVKVLSLGKEKGSSRFQYIRLFYRYIWEERKNYDVVFVHMNPIYLVLGGFIWKILGKKIGLWYTHKKVDMKLRIAEIFSAEIFTSTKDSFNIKSSKVHLFGHGIDCDLFQKYNRDEVPFDDKKITLAHVGRISPVKDCATFLRALSELKNEDKDRKYTGVFYGAPEGNRVDAYFQALDSELGITDNVAFVGSNTANYELFSRFQYANEDLKVSHKINFLINATKTGSFDKVVIEAMASGVIPLTCSASFREYFGKFADMLIFKEGDHNDLARKIVAILISGKMVEIEDYLKDVAKEKFDVKVLIKNIANIYEK